MLHNILSQLYHQNKGLGRIVNTLENMNTFLYMLKCFVFKIFPFLLCVLKIIINKLRNNVMTK